MNSVAPGALPLQNANATKSLASDPTKTSQLLPAALAAK